MADLATMGNRQGTSRYAFRETPLVHRLPQPERIWDPQNSSRMEKRILPALFASIKRTKAEQKTTQHQSIQTHPWRRMNLFPHFPAPGSGGQFSNLDTH